MSSQHLTDDNIIANSTTSDTGDDDGARIDPFSYLEDITSDDKLWAAIGYLLPIFAIIALVRDDKKYRPFVRYHAVQAITFAIVLWVIILLISIATFLFGSVCSPLVWLVTLWPAFDSYRGQYTRIPYVTNFIKKRGWVD